MSKGNEKKPDGRRISKKLKPRQRKFIAHYTDPTNKKTFGNGTRSAIAAGYTDKAPAEAAHQLLKNTQVEREIDRALDEVGATRKKVAQVLHNGLEAKTTRVFSQDGKVIYSDPLEDHPTQVRAAEVVGKMRGDFPTNREQDRITGLVFQQNIVIVPGGMPKPQEKGRNLRQLKD